MLFQRYHLLLLFGIFKLAIAEKQIKLEDIENDNLKNENVKTKSQNNYVGFTPMKIHYESQDNYAPQQKAYQQQNQEYYNKENINQNNNNYYYIQPGQSSNTIQMYVDPKTGEIQYYMLVPSSEYYEQNGNDIGNIENTYATGLPKEQVSQKYTQVVYNPPKTYLPTAQEQNYLVPTAQQQNYIVPTVENQNPYAVPTTQNQNAYILPTAQHQQPTANAAVPTAHNENGYAVPTLQNQQTYALPTLQHQNIVPTGQSQNEYTALPAVQKHGALQTIQKPSYYQPTAVANPNYIPVQLPTPFTPNTQYYQPNKNSGEIYNALKQQNSYYKPKNSYLPTNPNVQYSKDDGANYNPNQNYRNGPSNSYLPVQNNFLNGQRPVVYERIISQSHRSLLDSYVPSILQIKYYKEQEARLNALKQNVLNNNYRAYLPVPTPLSYTHTKRGLKN